MVYVRRGNVVVIDEDMKNVTNRLTNTVIVYAERAASASWDTECSHFAVEVDRCAGLGRVSAANGLFNNP
jgi:hypothetical protein